jgi:hypothetical protein
LNIKRLTDIKYFSIYYIIKLSRSEDRYEIDYMAYYFFYGMDYSSAMDSTPVRRSYLNVSTMFSG